MMSMKEDFLIPPLSVYVLCMCVSVCSLIMVSTFVGVSIHVCSCEDLKTSSWCQESFTLLIETVSLSQIQNSPVWLLFSFLWITLCQPAKARIIEKLPHLPDIYLGFWGSELWFSSLCSKHFNFWAISLVPGRIFYELLLHILSY